MTDLVGTPYYIAPEVIKRSYDEKCDIWSLGVILFTLLSGEPAFVGKTVDEVLKKVEGGKWSFNEHNEVWSKTSGEVKDLIKKMMTVDPK